MVNPRDIAGGPEEEEDAIHSKSTIIILHTSHELKKSDDSKATKHHTPVS